MQPGDRIPDFRAPASTGQTLERESFQGKVPLVMAFLPGVEADADIQELSEFNRLHADFGRDRVQVLGVVKATASEVREVAERLELTIPLLADAGGRIIADFGVMDEDGKASATTVVADRDGTVAAVFEDALSSGHAVQVLREVREMKQSDQYAMEPETG